MSTLSIPFLFLALSAIGYGEFQAAAQEMKILWQFETGGCISVSPAVGGEIVFVGACNGLFFAIDRHTGAPKWQYDIKNDGIQTGFHGRWLLTNDLVIVATDGDEEGYVYAFEQASGTIRWKHHVGHPIPSDVVQHGSLLFVLTQRDSLLALDLATGETRWAFTPPTSPRFKTFTSSPVIVGDHVVLSGRDGTIYSLRCDNGQVEWQYQTSAALTTPAVFQGQIYIGNLSENHVFAVSDTVESRFAQFKPSSSLQYYMPPVVSSWGCTTTTGTTIETWGLNLEHRLWKMDAPARFSRSPFVWGDKLIGGTVRGHVLAYNAPDGSLDFSVQLNGVIAGLAGYGDILYVGTQEGSLFALQPK